MSLTKKALVIALILACSPQIAIAEFAKLREDKVDRCDHELASIKDISYQCQVISDRSNSLEIWQNRLSFQFGQISRSQFNRLKNIYSGGRKTKSAVAYNSQTSYQLTDFLPPTIQALNHHRFIPEVAGDENKQLYMNCWGLIYEVLREAIDVRSQPVIFMGQGSLMLDLLRDNSYNLATLSEPEDKLAKSLVKPGDIILVLHKSSSGHEYLDHVAMAIDEGIYFEKAGTGAEVPIRITDETTIRQIWQPGVFSYEVRRLRENAVLPHPQAIFSLNSTTVRQEFKQLDITSDPNNTTIMWSEEEKDLATSSLFHLVNPLLLSIGDRGRAELPAYLYQPIFQSTVNSKQ